MRITYILASVWLLTISLTTSAIGSAKENPEKGIWTGTIGNSKVMACLKRSDNPEDPNESAYFYLRYAKPIPLIPHPGKKTSWMENDIKNPSGIWTISIQNNQITGNWSNPAKTRTLPILLDRFITISSLQNLLCNQDLSVFNPAIYPQLLSEKVTFGPEKTFNGKHYRVLSAFNDAVESIELIEENEIIAGLNTRLANELKVSMSSYYGCPTMGEQTSGKRGKNEKPDFNSSIAPVFWNAQWISFVTTTSGYCGSAHPFSDTSYSNWNLSTGQEVNLWTWIKNSKKKDGYPEFDSFYLNYSAPEPLNKIITKRAIKQRVAHYPKGINEKDDCLETIKNNNEYQIRLGKSGMIFSQGFPQAALACVDDIEIPYSQLMPFLTKYGKEAAVAIQQNDFQDQR